MVGTPDSGAAIWGKRPKRAKLLQMTQKIFEKVQFHYPSVYSALQRMDLNQDGIISADELKFALANSNILVGRDLRWVGVA